MKTNSKAVKDQIDSHILATVTDEFGDNYTDITLACNQVYSEFNRVTNYPHNLQRIPNNQDRFSDYLCGMPYNFHIYYHDITQFLNSLDINPNNKTYTDDEILKLYHHLIYRQILKRKTI